jgi:uncharacterized membrane protein
MLAGLPDGATARVDTVAGRYAIERAVLCRISPPPEHDDEDAVRAAMCGAVVVGPTRTMQQDVSYGLRQLADIAVKALSPGINDPTTAQDAIFHAAAVLSEMLRRDPPPVELKRGSATIILAQQPTPDELVRLAFAETRRAAAGQPAVCVYLLEAIELLVESLRAGGLEDRTTELVRQAHLVAIGASRQDPLAEDVAEVAEAYAKRFVGTCLRAPDR